jgi:hypothetical protein
MIKIRKVLYVMEGAEPREVAFVYAELANLDANHWFCNFWLQTTNRISGVTARFSGSDSKLLGT